MKFHKILTSIDNLSLRDKEKMFLMLCLLHKNGKINHDSIKALFKSLNNDTLIRVVKTHHSKFNDKWYDNENILSIYQDVISKLELEFDFIDLEECIKYNNLFLNKPRNFCIDHIYFQFIKPIISEYYIKSKYSHDIISSFDIVDKSLLFDKEDYEKYLPPVKYYDYEESYDDSHDMFYTFSYFSERKIANKQNLEKIFGNYLDSKKKVYLFGNLPSKITNNL